MCVGHHTMAAIDCVHDCACHYNHSGAVNVGLSVGAGSQVEGTKRHVCPSSMGLHPLEWVLSRWGIAKIGDETVMVPIYSVCMA